ncbi:prolipoprotein diacylglyceryl transferase [Novibacillus thermophilus]
MMMAAVQALDPIAFKLGPLSVHWYGIILGTATLVGLWVAVREGRRHGWVSDVFFDMLVWVLPAAIVGARLYYVIFQWDYYAQNPMDIIAVWKGGIAIHGALIGAITAGYFYTRKKGIPFLQMADIVAPSLLLGQAIGRWGNFMNQEAHGGEVSRSFLEDLHLPDWIVNQMYIDGAYYHPTFLYESVWNVVGVAILVVLRKFNPRRGEIFFGYLIWYSLGRFFIEGLRTDSLAFDGPVWLEGVLEVLWSPMYVLFEPGAMAYGNIRTAQLVSVLTVIAAVAVIIVRRSTGRAKVKYLDAGEVPEAT